MNSFKKGFLTIAFTFVMVMAMGVVNVNAQDYDFSTIQDDFFAGTEYVLGPDDNLTFLGEAFVGKDGRIAVDNGTATIKYDQASETVNITLDGNATLNADQQFIMELNVITRRYSIKLTVNEDSILNVDGTLAIPSGTKGILVNNGTINVNGALEIRNSGSYQATGTTNVYGDLAVYGPTATNLGNSIVTLYEGGNIYSESADISANVLIGEDTDSFEVVENAKSYVSITDTLTSDFDYGYTLKAKEVEEIPVVDPDDETVDEVTPPAEETVENPETSDGVLLFLSLTAVGLIGVALTFKRLCN